MKKPFFEHLKELNLRIVFSFSLIVVLSIFIYAKYPFFIEVLNEPLINAGYDKSNICLLYTSPSPRDATLSRMPSSA